MKYVLNSAYTLLLLAVLASSAGCGSSSPGGTTAVSDADTASQDAPAVDGGVNDAVAAEIAEVAQEVATEADAVGADAVGTDSLDGGGVGVDTADATAADIPAGCTQNKECAAPTPCLQGSCVAGSCTFALALGPCDDGNACSTGDACKNGVCAPVAALNCDDGNPCSQDACDLATGCTHTDANGAVCDDGQKCSTDDVCKGGKCLGSKAQCADDNACTDDTCLDNSGCVHLPSSATCNDGNVCTSGDTCSAGKCTPGAITDCDDKDACTVDSCELTAGCVHVQSTGPCSDANACTTGDTCAIGLCVGATVDCDDKNPCTDDSCDVASGCAHAANTVACSDGNACTAGDACKNGVCAPVAALSCDDGNPCSQDACDLATGCTHTDADGASCSDNDACTQADVCGGGTCAGKQAVCNDGNACTNDTCAPASGCVFKNADANACTDGNLCTVGDKCVGGVCALEPDPCNDFNPCTSDACQVATGCTHKAVGTSCNGACVDLTIDPANCGSCGVACPPAANGTPFCSASVCGFGCKAGFGDCNALGADGCEATLNTVSKCGSCNNACSAANASSLCTNAVCALGACNAGFVNCNGLAADGCEVAIASDVANCGSCGKVCAANQKCVSKFCTTCAHSECMAGVKLVNSCNACAMSICSADSYCCDVDWDKDCVSAAKAIPSCNCP